MDIDISPTGPFGPFDKDRTNASAQSITTDPVALQMLVMQQETPLLVALFDERDVLRFANGAFRATFGLAHDEVLTWVDLIRKSYVEGTGTFVDTTDFEAWLAPARSRRGKLPFRAFECDMCDGRWMWMTETVRSDGWMLCIASDITELKASERAVRQARDVALRAAQTDVLTGISNRAHIMQLLEQSIVRSRLDQQPCCMALMDLDYFKRVNDTFGHQGGDVILKHFVRTVSETLRREDVLGRVGGEEFLLLLPGIDEAAATEVMSRILGLLRESRPLVGHPDFAYTSSAGLCLIQPDEDARSVYHRADQALYAAKAAGRDQFIWAL